MQNVTLANELIQRGSDEKEEMIREKQMDEWENIFAQGQRSGRV